MDLASRTEPIMPAASNTDLEPTLALMAEWPLRSFEFMLQSQQLQLETWRCWQGSLQTLQSEAWDWWASHWAGGVPLDG
jgi:hypothetical protein